MEKGVSSPLGFILMQKKLNQSETAMKPREDDRFYCRETDHERKKGTLSKSSDKKWALFRSLELVEDTKAAAHK
ncbi:hypothetical protein LguiA_034706 [Lonicera macranthoides]